MVHEPMCAAASFTLHTVPAQDLACSWGASQSLPSKKIKSVNHTLLRFRHPIPAVMVRLMPAQQLHELRQIFKLETRVLTRLCSFVGVGICVGYFADPYS